MKRSDVERQLYFLAYTLKPFRPLMAARQGMARLKSLLGLGRGFRVVDLALDYACNLDCGHCSAMVLRREAPVLSLSDYRDIVRQARGLDNLSFNITGGEPLMSDRLDALIHLLEPLRHYVSIQTNGTLLTRKRAGRLRKLGVNCITTSLDSADPEIHNAFRGSPKAFDRTLAAVENARSAGMQVLVGATVSHQTLRSGDLETLIRLVNGMGAIFLFNLAVPCGRWSSKDDLVLRGDDREYLAKLMDRYPATATDHEPGRNAKGCPAATEKIYITPYGDVLPCPFIHIAFGNVKKDPLKAIVSRMQAVSYFKGYPPICVAAEDRDFHRRILSRDRFRNGQDLPVDFRDIWGTP
ncbi:radical SAM/SPASM domain-containing protein [Desulfatiferula olefinivorans]